MSETNEPTFGEKAVELHFNPSGLEASLHLKAQAAAFIDSCHELREKSQNPEVQRMASIAITQAQAAQMWATKAAVWEAGLGATDSGAAEI